MFPLSRCLLLAAVVVAIPTAAHAARYDTLVDWHDQREEASRRAADHGKLLFAMHISGELPDARFT